LLSSKLRGNGLWANMNDTRTSRYLQKARYGQTDDQILPVLRDKAMT